MTHGEETRTKEVPFGTQTIIDPSLQPGEVTVRQEGENGEIQQTYAVTYVDGVKESETLTGEKTTKIAIDKVIAVGPEKTTDDTGKSDNSGNGNSNGDNGDSGKTDDGKNDSGKNDSNKNDNKSDSNKSDSDKTDSNKSDSSDKNNSKQQLE